MAKPLIIQISGLDTQNLGKLREIPADLKKIDAEEERLHQNREKRSPKQKYDYYGPPTPTRSQWKQIGSDQSPEYLGPPMPTAAQWRRMDRVAQQQARNNDPAYVEAQARARTRYTPNGWGGQSGHILGVDRAKLKALGLDHVIKDIEGSAPPPPTDIVKALTAGLGGSGGGAGLGAAAGLAGFAPELAIAAAALGALAIGANYATKNLKGMAVAGAAYNPMFEEYGISPGSLSGNLNGIQAALAMRAGINPIGGYYGDNNYAEKQKKALRFIRSAPTYDEARRRAEGLGMPEAAAAWDLNEQNFNDLVDRSAPTDAQRGRKANQDQRFNSEKTKALDFLGGLATYTLDAVGDPLNNLTGGLYGPTKAAIDFVTDYFNLGGRSNEDGSSKQDPNSPYFNPNMSDGVGTDNIRGAIPTNMRGAADVGMNAAHADALRQNLL